MLSLKILREYDIRGVVGPELGAQQAHAIGRGFGSILRRNGGTKICVGWDGRLSSPELEEALVKGLVACGLHVIRIGLGPTPMTYFANYFLKTDAAIMITGSHNPGDYNGFKMVLGKKSFYGNQIQELGKLIAKEDYVMGKGTVENKSVSSAYLDYLLNDFKTHYPEARDLSIAWDAGNGATGEVLSELVKRLPGKHILLNEKIDGLFPAHHPDPTVAENLIELQKAVSLNACDLGIAFDGDGDRIGVVDDEGNILWGDQLMMLYAEEVLGHKSGSTIIADVKASQTLFDHIAALGGIPLMWRPGHSLIKAKMFETSSPLAGEMSGHIFFADRHYGYDDALYAALRLLGILARRPGKLSDWFKSLPKTCSTPEIRIPCETQDKFGIVEEIKSALLQTNAKIIDVDGIRVIYDRVIHDKGWWLLRASNTQEVLVARVEAGNERDLEHLKQDLRSHLGRFGLEKFV